MTVGWRTQMAEAVLAYVRRHAGPMLILVGALVAGVVVGALLAGSVTAQDRLALARDVQNLVHGQSGLGFVDLLRLSLPRYLGLAGLLWLLGVTVVGFVGVPVVLFWRGLVTGFGVGFLIDILGWQGLLLSLAVIVPPNLIALTALLLAGSTAVAFSVGLWQRRFHRFGGELLGFTGHVAVAAAALVIAACVEAALGLALAKFGAAML